MTLTENTDIKLPASLSALRVMDYGSPGYVMLLLRPDVEVELSATPQDDIFGEAPFAYCDYETDASTVRLIDYQPGALRDDFDFGPAVFVRKDLLRHLLLTGLPDYKYAGWYDLRLRLTQYGLPSHISTPLFRAVAKDAAAEEGEAQFAYVNPRNREVQLEMERAVTDYLSRIDALVLPEDKKEVTPDDDPTGVTASVIIPVLNRARTIADAVKSALAQKTDFAFNVIVIDNRSTDGTSEILADLAADDERLHVIDTSEWPDRTFGIGGCWNLGINSEFCGTYAVQLDSDDLYEAPDVLQRIVDTFRRKKCGMVVGAYTLTDFDGRVLPPGLIDHREWTDSNGANNALRINGFGAPRAFVRDVAREISFPNVSYGEDYAMALAVSREYKVGRIYHSLYLCRRWEDNTDHQLSPEKINAHNLYKDSVRSRELAARRAAGLRRLGRQIDSLIDRQTASWPMAAENFRLLAEASAERASLTFAQYPQMKVMKILAPHRRRSAIADVTLKALRERGCFLCKEARPQEQEMIETGGYHILVNPYPVTERHLTIAAASHTPQRLSMRVKDMVRFAGAVEGRVVFFNGARCGASAPDHFHFQVVTLPDELMYRLDEGMTFANLDVTCVPWIGLCSQSPEELICKAEAILRRLSGDDGEEAGVNVALTFDGLRYMMKIFPRRAHRPRCFGEGEGRLAISPASVEMLGLFVTSSPSDFDALTPEKVVEIYEDVCVTPEEFSHIKTLVEESL